MSVAKELVRLSLSADEPDPLTNLRLQKLLYYAQAWSLVIRRSELFPEDIRAWQHGPVTPDVYQALPGQGAACLTIEQFAGVPDLPAEEAEFVAALWRAYGGRSATQLSKLTHGEAPWRRAWGDRPSGARGDDEIDVGGMQDYFAARPVPGPLAAFSGALRRREEEAQRALNCIPQLDPAALRAAAKAFSPSVKR
jgi:uncharacterized phage-associated protein